MDKLRVIEVKKSVYAHNDKEAAENRNLLKKQDTFMMNLMSSPGSGKTTMLVSTLDFVVVENIGNLICPASYDLGQNLNCMILSVPEGSDKPLKYPKMFAEVDVLIISKTDALSPAREGGH